MAMHLCDLPTVCLGHAGYAGGMHDVRRYTVLAATMDTVLTYHASIARTGFRLVSCRFRCWQVAGGAQTTVQEQETRSRHWAAWMQHATWGQVGERGRTPCSATATTARESREKESVRAVGAWRCTVCIWRAAKGEQTEPKRLAAVRNAGSNSGGKGTSVLARLPGTHQLR